MTVLAYEPKTLEYLADPSGDLTVLDVIGNDRWQSRPADRSFGFTNDAIWMRVDVPRDRNLAFLTIQNAWIDDVEVYMTERGHVVTSYHTGGDHPADSRPVAHPTFAFPFPAGDIDTIYLRDHGKAAVLYPLAMYTQEDYQRSSTATLILRGGYYGILIIMLLYNLTLYVTLRDRFYAYFVAYAACLGWTLMTSDGIAHLYALPLHASLLDASGHAAVAGTMVFVGLFCLAFLNTEKYLPRVTKAARWYFAVLIANAAVQCVFRNTISETLEATFVIVTGIGLLGVSLTRWRQGAQFAPIFVFATGSMAVCAVIFAFLHFGWVPINAFTRNSAVIGSMIELVVLSLALSTRLRNERDMRARIRARSFELARRVRELQTAAQFAEEHRELQRSLQQAQKQKTIGQLTGGFAHEFNNILASILGFTELAQAQAKTGQLIGYLAEVEKATGRAADLVKRLMAYSSRSVSHLSEKIDLVSEIDETIAFLRASLPATVSLNTNLPDKPVRSAIASSQMRDLLINLCLNASEAMQTRGSIEVSLEHRTCDELVCDSCMSRFSGRFWAIKVEDEGPGVGMSKQDLFTPFFTSKEVGQGAGLGLSVVHGIAHEHNGHITVATRAPTGARFTVFIPDDLPLPDPKEAGVSKILLIEDDAAVGRYLKTLLNEQAYDVKRATLPTHALEAFMAQPDDYDLIITVQQMPHLTGLEIARDIHALRPEVPIILTSGNPNIFDTAELAIAGIRDVFGKPIEADRLLAKIRGLLHTQQPV